MSYREERINEALNSRGFALLAGVLLALLSWLALGTGRFGQADTGNGIFFSIADDLGTASPQLSLGLNVVALLLVAALTMLLNKRYNFVRSVSHLPASMFLLLQAACPMVCTHFNTGTALCLTAVLAQFILFSTYQQKGQCQQRIYLVFTVLSLGCMFQYAFVMLILAFFIGLLQMRALDLRGLLAMLFGLATPFWIGLGLGLVDPRTAMLPHIEAIWTNLPALLTRLVVVATTVVAALAVVLMAVNAAVIMNWRLQTRVYNGFIMVLCVIDMAMMCVDYRNLLIYLPTLNWCVAVQIAHAYTRSTLRRRYIFLFVLILAALLAWVANLMAQQ